MIDELIIACKQNDRNAQGQLYKKLAPTIFGVCLKYSSSYEEAQDNLQEIFIHLFNKINSFKNEGSFEGWVKRLAINFILQQYRGKIPVFEVITEKNVKEESFEIDNSKDFTEEQLLKMIQELPNQYRLVFNLYVIDNYSHKEIAQALNISEGTSKSNLSRAKQLLKNKINSNLFFSKLK